MGMRQASRAAGERIVKHRTTAPVADNGAGDETGIPRAVEYSRLREGTLRPNTDWENSLAKLAQPPRKLARFAQLSADEQELVRLRRTARRQYDGAPPIAPHPLDQMSATTCMECHGKPTTISGIAVPQMSHPFQATACNAMPPTPSPIRRRRWPGPVLAPARATCCRRPCRAAHDQPVPCRAPHHPSAAATFSPASFPAGARPCWTARRSGLQRSCRRHPRPQWPPSPSSPDATASPAKDRFAPPAASAVPSPVRS